MIRWLNLRNVLAAIAIIIVSGSVIYSQYLSRKIAKDERLKVENWVEAQRTIMNTETETIPPLAIKIIQENVDIPIIETDEKDSITNYRNIDSTKVANNTAYLKDKLRQYKAQHPPITLKLSDTPY